MSICEELRTILRRSLPLDSVHLRHQAFTQAMAGSCLEAAGVCLRECQHLPPQDFQMSDDDEQELIEVTWQTPDDKAHRAWTGSKLERAVEDGACIFAIAAVELRRNLFAHQPAWKGSGIDYILLPGRIYLTPNGAEDLEEAWGLEVSGTICGKAEVRKRLQKKLKQAKEGKSDLPTIACVVGFKVKLIAMQTLAT